MGNITSDPGLTIASNAKQRACIAPLVTTISEAGSKSALFSDRIFSEIASLNSRIPAFSDFWISELPTRSSRLLEMLSWDTKSDAGLGTRIFWTGIDVNQHLQCGRIENRLGMVWLLD